MNIAELFVNLGIKGSEKTVGAISNVKKGLGDVKTVSLEAKAGIIAAMYAIERLFAASGATGTGLTNFNALTGLSIKQLQQYQYAARQAGLSNEEFTGSLKAVQNGMTNMLLGKGAPEGLAMVANKVGFDTSRARDTFYVLEQLQKFAKSAPPDIGNSVLKSFGVSEGTIAAMRRNAFNPQAFAKAPTYGAGEIAALDKANIAWSNLGNKIEMAVGHFNALHGGQLVKDISMITDSILKLANAFIKLSDSFKLFEKISQAMEGFANTFKLIGEIADKVSGKDSKKGDLLYKAPGQETFPGLKDSPVGKFFRDIFSGIESPLSPSAVAPSVAPFHGGPATTVNVNQNLNFQHDGKDHKKTSDSVKKANQDAFRQYNQGEVS